MISEIIGRVRRNHALEHATIHVLSDKYKGFAAQGNASINGYFLNIYGDIAPEAIAAAANEALERMRRGEHQLALHPNCGTVLLTTATMATIASQAVFAMEQRRLKKSRLDQATFFNVLPSAILASVIALITSKPVGMYLQTFTTDGRPGSLRIVQVQRNTPNPLTHIFRVLLGRNKRTDVNAYFIETAER